jgi:hypothetical protein
VPQSRAAGAPQSAARERRTLSERVLHAAGATFARDGVTLVPPFWLDVCAGERASLALRDARAAKVAARMVAGIVKTTCGTLLVCDFDPRIQPVQAKRLAGFVPAQRDCAPCGDAGAAIDLQAALFEVPRKPARQRVDAVLAALGTRDAAGFAVALALVRPIKLLVLDRPSPEFEARVAQMLDAGTALVCTGVGVDAPAAILAAR